MRKLILITLVILGFSAQTVAVGTEDTIWQDIFMKQAKGRIAIASRAAEAANKRFNDSSRHIFRQSPERIAVNATKQATSIFDGLKAVNLHSFEFNRDHLVNFVERMNVLINGTYHLDVTMVYCERSFEQLMAALEQLEVITAQSSQSEKGKTQKELMTEYRNVAKLKKLVLPKKRQDQRDVRKFKETLAVIKRTQETASRLGKEFKAEAAWLEQVERKTIDALHRITNMIMQSKIKADKNFEASEQKFLAQMNDARRLEHRSAAEARKVAPGTGPNLQPAFV